MASSSDLLESIFTAAVALDQPFERAAYLDRSCADDPELRRQADLLLNAHDRNGHMLDKPVERSLVDASFDVTYLPHTLEPSRTDTQDASVSSTGIERPGMLIANRYKLLETIGEGGMGTVWVAEQLEPVRRTVAIKLVKSGMDSRQVISRFEAERQALAVMDHPNIARVFDGGVTEHGRPYFVMEYVNGVAITEYCDTNRLTPRERLELFVLVCQAIQHAHQKGIIHRDIKPSNVMIACCDGKPIPKVIDFGVAKAIDQELTDRTLLTQFGTLVGTLEYMSPEQAEKSALGIDTRSDVYSLGVLLYELLTGSTPLSRQRMKDTAYAEILRMIREVEPPKPSTRLSEAGQALASISAQRHMDPARLTQSLRSELDWIVMKTLEKDRNRRYETASGLAADVIRYLRDEPVQACAPSASYRFQKFARRNKSVLATASLVALALVVGTVVSVLQAIRATDAEGRASGNYETAEVQRLKAESQLLLTEQAREQGLLRLYESRLSQAQAGSLSRRAGQRIDSLDTLSEATRLARQLQLPAEQDLRLRNAAIACLALTDLRVAREWAGWPAGSVQLDFDGNLEHYARSDRQGAVSIRRVADDVQVSSIPAQGEISWPMFSRDGTFIATSNTRGLGVWSVLQPQATLVLQIDAGIMNGMDFSPDSRQFVLGQSDGLITVYDLVTGKPPRQLRVGLPGAQLVVGSQQQLAISCNSTVEIRDMNTGEVAATLPHPAPVNNLGWHPDGKMVAVACDNLKVYLWDTIAAKQVFVLEGFRNYGNVPAFSHSGDFLATTGWEGKTRLWDTQTGRQLFTTTGVGSMIPRFSADDRFLGFSIRDDKLRIWEIAKCAEYRTLVHTSADSQDPYFNPTVFGDGQLLAVGVLGGIGVWDLSSGRELHFLDLPGIGFTASEHSGTLLTNGVAGLLRWEVKRDASSSSVFHVAPPQKLAVPGSVYDIACSRNGSVIASAQSTGAVVVHLDRPDQPVQLTPHADVRYVSVSADGKLVATGSHSDAAVRIWDAAAGTLLKVLPGASWRPAFSPDGKWLGTVAGGYRLWKVGTWEEGPKIGGGEGAAFSPDSTLLAVESGEGSIRLVDPNTGNEYARLEDPSQDRARHITFSPDGTQLIATNDDSRSIHVWDLRLIRERLTKLGLDWALPEYPPAESGSVPATSIEIDPGTVNGPSDKRHEI